MITEKRKAYLKEYRSRPKVRERQAIRFKKWYLKVGKQNRKISYESIVLYRQKHQKQVNASRSLIEYMKYHNIPKPTKCTICNKEGHIHGHHIDYDKKFDVLWICASCHKRIHLGIIKI